ncbi:SGNH/GDSL hydrolase family protein [Pedobacter metabolipauper]|uniref:Lysophospholipase L1-like esterase n=1 Tax=Pedobacter metabolipauper TaxID=425513 RepID=A0A4R6SX96_9SPHI|nr:SGNH/GDSL hydrolase family protein [Pedobacter metabolipauper]TDQ09264.1 lysophospholipase L1-like esterase [Pedobacter metabolipauper]
MKIFVVFLGLFLATACTKHGDTDPVIDTKVNMETKQLTYLALGDSYTIGESVPLKSNFPNQLVQQLSAKGIAVEAPQIIARTGWTTSELQGAIKSAAVQKKYDLVTLLIGVNNQYRGESAVTYRKEFKELLQTAIGFAGDKTHVFVVSIPDWGVTPFGKKSGRNPETVSNEINAFNAINREETLMAGVSYTDITPASRAAASDLSLVADDGLHPSGKMYLDWALQVSPAVLKILK